MTVALRRIALALLVLGLCACSTDTTSEPPTLALGEFPAAIQSQIQTAQSRALEQPENADASGLLAMTLQAYGLREPSEFYYRRARELAPGDFRWVYLHAVTQQSLGRRVEAIESLRNAVALDDRYVPARLRLGQLLAEEGDLAGAKAVYAALAETMPGDARVLLGQGKIAVAENDLDAAIDLLERAAAAGPYGAVHFELIAAYRAQGRVNDAERHSALFEKYRGVEPALPDRLLFRVAEQNKTEKSRTERAQQYLAAGRLKYAKAELDAVLEQNPESANAHSLLIVINGASGNAEQAEYHYDAGVAIDPELPQLHGNLGVLRFEQGRLAEAADAFAESIRVDPEYADGHLKLGAVREKQKRYEEAKGHFRDAIAVEPSNRQAHFFLARLLELDGDLDGAIAQLRLTVEPVDKQTPWYYRALGNVYLNARDYDAAEQALDRGSEIAKQTGDASAINAIDDVLQRLEAVRNAARDSSDSS